MISFSKIDGTVDNFDRNLNIEFIRYETNNRSWKNTIQLLKVIRKHNVRYIYFTDQRAFDYRYALIRLMGAKKIIVHNRISVEDPNPAPYEGGLKGAVKFILGRWHLITADRIYAVSDFVRNRLIMKNRISPARVVKILNGVDIDSFKPTSTGKSVKVAKPLRIFSGGRATSHKGIHILIEAVELLRSRTDNKFEVRYAGDGPELNSFRAMADKFKLGNCFSFLGEMKSTREEVLAADIVVVPSIWGDACPSSVSEALAAGKPLIATSVGGVPEIVGDDNHALLISPDDPEELCDALRYLLDSRDARDNIGKRARQRAEFALDQNIYYQHVINQLIEDFEG